MRNRQAGLTLIETILVLLVAAITVGGIWLAYSQINLNSQVDRTVKALDETVQVTRDYLSTKTAVESTLSEDLRGPPNLMPRELTYEYSAATTTTKNGQTQTTTNTKLADVDPNTIIYMSPLGTEFFVQAPQGNPKGKTYFEVRIGFLNSAGTVNVSQCMAIVNRLVDSKSAMLGRGMVGYWVGSADLWNPGNGDAGFNPSAMRPILDGANAVFNSSSALYNNCAGAIDIRLYFSMRP